MAFLRLSLCSRHLNHFSLKNLQFNSKNSQNLQGTYCCTIYVSFIFPEYLLQSIPTTNNTYLHSITKIKALDEIISLFPMINEETVFHFMNAWSFNYQKLAMGIYICEHQVKHNTTY